MTILEALEEFLQEKRVEGKRPATIRWYQQTVSYLLREHLDQPLVALNRSLVTQALLKNVSQATLGNYDRALRGFCNWLVAVGYLDKNPFQGRKRPRQDFRPRQVLSLDEIAALFAAARKDPRFRFRNQAILALALGAGLRASEICRLTLQDIQWEEAVLRVEGKTGFSVVPLTKDTLRYLRLYVDRERRATIPYLFVHRNRPLNANALSRWIHRLAKTAGIDRPVGMHLLRHTFATHFLKSGGDPFTLQRILRHKTPAMTSRYLHLLTEDLRERLQTVDLVALVKRGTRPQ
ncbi:tyrosine-type recombinase/integrase [Thermus tengchongensis]|uniref:tyrosine-type recombinase/integrase n=1 Tax=Thermus tengchongensis TaxID=1214928 RepID=UPI001F3F8792|nr:tyrosine-type recombinase/integrase [Thermus tengchongensis]